MRKANKNINLKKLVALLCWLYNLNLFIVILADGECDDDEDAFFSFD